MKAVEKVGRTVEDAIAEALRELGVDRSAVDVTILEEGAKGRLFGFLGGRQARVRVALRDPFEEKERAALAFLEDILPELGVRPHIETRREAIGERHALHITLSGENLGLVIGRYGQTLDALQYLAGVVANRIEGPWVRVVLDAEGYRAKRAEQVRVHALRAAERAKRLKRRVSLEPMSAHERRMVHLILENDAEVETRSEGVEPHRYVVVVPRPGV